MHLALELGQKHFEPHPQHQILKPVWCSFYMGVPPGVEHTLPKRKISCNNFFYLGKEEDLVFFGVNKGTAITVMLKYYIL